MPWVLRMSLWSAATAAVSDIAPAWRERLHPRGRLLLPLWLGVEQSVLLLKLVRITCKASGLDPVRFAAAKPHDRPGRHRQPRFPRRRPSHHCYVTVREVQQRLSFWLAVHEPYLLVYWSQRVLRLSCRIFTVFPVGSMAPGSFASTLLSRH